MRKKLFSIEILLIFIRLRRQARNALKVKTQLAFQEAFDLQERLAQQHEERLKQRALCEQLANQVKCKIFMSNFTFF